MKELALIACLIGAELCLSSALVQKIKASNIYIRDRVVMLTGKGQCTGVQIMSPLGHNYILTARHCEGIATNGVMVATIENGVAIRIRIVKTSRTSDLLLLQPVPNLIGINIADKTHKHEHVRALTHGGGFLTWFSEGELLDTKITKIALGAPPEEAECKKAHGKVEDMYCVMSVNLMFTTAHTMPGSSGGPVIDDSGRLIGTVTGGTPEITGLTPLDDIHKFLKDL